MKRIGIIGGIGPESTVDYYRGIISLFRKKTGGADYPTLLVNSINMNEMLAHVSAGRRDKLAAMLLAALGELARAGADVAAIASNTPHMVFDEVSAKSPLPLISIVEATCDRAKSLGVRRALLIGTAFTMRSSFYPDCFARHAIPMLAPSPEEQELIHSIIFPELEEGIVVQEKKKQLLGICDRIIRKEQVDGLVLGCTELPLMVKEDDLAIHVLNTTQIHIEAIVSELLR